MKTVFSLLLLFISILHVHAESFLKEWEPEESLETIIDSVEYNLENLPKKSQTSKKVWSGSDWPLISGGTARGGYRSPLGKLERVSPMSIGAVAWEQAHADYNKRIPWAGHCNGLSVAGIIYDEPKSSVRYKNVIFSIRDIKALMIELNQGPAKKIVGNICANTNSSIHENSERNADIQNRNCVDLNPAIFHLALGNIIGLRKKAFIVDRALGEPVYNEPIVKFKSRIKDTNSRIGLSPKAVRAIEVKTNVTFASNLRDTYKYVLGLDERNNIVSGKWIGNSKKDHPEFIWLPEVQGLENPFIDFLTVEEIILRSF